VAFVACKQKNAKRKEPGRDGDQYTFIALASTARAICHYRTGKRDSANTLSFAHDLRERVLGAPEISTDGFLPYQNAIRSRLVIGCSRSDRKDLQCNKPQQNARCTLLPAQVVA